MIPNDDNYLLLKQLLVVHQTCVLGAEVDLNTTRITAEGSERAIKRVLGDIEENFTIPYYMLENNPVGFDIGRWLWPLTQLNGSDTVNEETQKWITETDTPECIARCVTDYPKMTPHYNTFKESLQEGQTWGNSRQVACEVVSQITSGFRFIRRWSEPSDGRVPLVQILILVNIIIQIESLFQYINDFHSVEKDGKH